MIERLENAGLGFFVRATETQQRLGKLMEINGSAENSIKVLNGHNGMRVSFTGMWENFCKL